MNGRQDRIGFIGLGTMGAPMASNLIKTGWDLVVFDIDQTRCATLKENTNCVIASSPEDVMNLASRLITMLPTSEQVDAALFGEKGAVGGMQPGDIVIEMSTGQIDQLERQARQIQSLDAILIDAPVCLSPAEAATGNLISLVGGDRGDIERVSDLLDALSQRVIHAGPTGYGLRLKLVNNYMSMINHVLTAEVLALAAAVGLDRQLTVDLLQNTAAGRGQLLTNFPKKVLRGDTTADFPINMGIKDLSMAIAMFDQMKDNAAFGSLARQLFDDAAKAGFGGKDCTAMLEYFDERFTKELLQNVNLD
jgi:4-hydroxybutyrate dehydrogenase/sulfolactaldehyde 3-reductase